MTFSDPDFFNGIWHAMRVVEGVARQFSRLTYDVTIQGEHLLRHGDRLGWLRATGFVLVTSAFESFNDHVLAALLKGHTRADVHRAVARTASRREVFAEVWELAHERAGLSRRLRSSVAPGRTDMPYLNELWYC